MKTTTRKNNACLGPACASRLFMVATEFELCPSISVSGKEVMKKIEFLSFSLMQNSGYFDFTSIALVSRLECAVTDASQQL